MVTFLGERGGLVGTGKVGSSSSMSVDLSDLLVTIEQGSSLFESALEKYNCGEYVEAEGGYDEPLTFLVSMRKK